jgi:transcription factor TGA
LASISGTGASPPEYMTTASTQYAPAPLRMGMYDRHQGPPPPPPHQQQQPVVGMWSTDPFKVDSGGGQATSGSTIMEGDTKYDHAGVSNGLLFLFDFGRSFACAHFGCG